MVILRRPIMTVKTPMPAATFRWIRYTKDEYDDVLFKRKVGRALPGHFPFLPKQLADIRAQHPGLSDEDFNASYWVCEGACMLCGEPLNDKQRCPVKTVWFSRVPVDERGHTTHIENIVSTIRFWYWRLWWCGWYVKGFILALLKR